MASMADPTPTTPHQWFGIVSQCFYAPPWAVKYGLEGRAHFRNPEVPTKIGCFQRVEPSLLQAIAICCGVQKILAHACSGPTRRFHKIWGNDSCVIRGI